MDSHQPASWITTIPREVEVTLEQSTAIPRPAFITLSIARRVLVATWEGTETSRQLIGCDGSLVTAVGLAVSPDGWLLTLAGEGTPEAGTRQTIHKEGR